MENLIIANYRFDESMNRFGLVQVLSNECLDIPNFFYVVKNGKMPNIKSQYIMYCQDLTGKPFQSGLRELRPNIFYGDRYWNPWTKSFIILRYLEKNTVELHYFDKECPKNVEERSPFVTWYFSESGIAGLSKGKSHIIS